MKDKKVKDKIKQNDKLKRTFTYINCIHGD